VYTNYRCGQFRSFANSLQLTTLLADHGSTSLLDVRQAEQLVYTAGEEIPSLEQQIEQEENAISILLGDNPAAIPRGQELTDQPHPPEVREHRSVETVYRSRRPLEYWTVAVAAIIGWIVLIIWCVEERSLNRYGGSPQRPATV
jgi:outer membrane protein TolC